MGTGMMKKVIGLAAILVFGASLAFATQPVKGKAVKVDKAIQAGKAALVKAEAEVLRARLGDILKLLKAAAPAARAGADEKRRLAIVSNLVNARVSAAKGDAGGTARFLDAAARSSKTATELGRCWQFGMDFLSNAAKANNEAAFGRVAGVVRARIAPRIGGPAPFVTLADASRGLKKGFKVGEVDLVAAMRRAKDARWWNAISTRVEHLAIRLDKGDGKTAAGLFARLERSAPRKAVAFSFHQARFRVMFKRRQWKAAEQAAETMLAVADNTQQKLAGLFSLQDLACACRRAGDAKSAARAFARAQKIAKAAPFSTKSVVNTGNMLREFGLSANAEMVYRVGLGKAPRDRDITLAFANMLSSRNRFEEAETLCRKALGTTPADRGLTLALFEALSRQGKFDVAVEAVISAKLPARDLFEAARRMERARSFLSAEKLLAAIKPEALKKNKWLAAGVKDATKRVLERELASVKARLARSTRLAALFAVRAKRAKAAKNDSQFKEQTARSRAYRQEAHQMGGPVRKLEAKLKTFGK